MVSTLTESFFPKIFKRNSTPAIGYSCVRLMGWISLMWATWNWRLGFLARLFLSVGC
uniref:Uncharacterized protein n=1 Tax=Anguilla anguilla TaxID=7936 RepID=A0A0E9W3V5_ANGAN